MAAGILTEDKRYSSRLAQKKAVGKAKPVWMELDDSEVEERVEPRLVKWWTDFGVVKTQRVTRVDDYVTKTFAVQWVSWDHTRHVKSVRLMDGIEWVDADELKDVGPHNSDAESFYRIMFVKHSALTKLLKSQNTNMRFKMQSQAKFTLVHLGKMVAKSYKHPDDTNHIHHYWMRKTPCTTASAPFVEAIIREKIGDTHEGLTYFVRGKNKGRLKSLKLTNEGVAKLFSDKVAVRRFNSTWLGVYNLILRWKRMSKVPMLQARFDVFHQRADGTRMGHMHTDPSF